MENPKCCTGRKKPSAFRVKGSGWVLFPSTMAEQPIQQNGGQASVLSGMRRTVIVVLVYIICVGRP